MAISRDSKSPLSLVFVIVTVLWEAKANVISASRKSVGGRESSDSLRWYTNELVIDSISYIYLTYDCFFSYVGKKAIVIKNSESVPFSVPTVNSLRDDCFRSGLGKLSV